MAQALLFDNIPALTAASTTSVTLGATNNGQSTLITVGGQQYSLSNALTLSTATIGAANGLDAGALGVSQIWYVYAIVNSSSFVLALLASLSNPSIGPTIPSGYTNAYKNIGSFSTDSSSLITTASQSSIPAVAGGPDSLGKWTFGPATFGASSGHTMYGSFGINTAPVQLGSGLTTLKIAGTVVGRSGGLHLVSSDNSLGFAIYGATSDSPTLPFHVGPTSNHGIRFMTNNGATITGTYDNLGQWSFGTTSGILSALTLNNIDGTTGQNILTVTGSYGGSIISEQSGAGTMYVSNAYQTAVSTPAYAKRTNGYGSMAMILRPGTSDATTTLQFRYAPFGTNSATNTNTFWNTPLATVDGTGAWIFPNGYLQNIGTGGVIYNEGFVVSRLSSLATQRGCMSFIGGGFRFTSQSGAATYGGHLFEQYNGTTQQSLVSIGNSTTIAGTFSATDSVMYINKASATSRSINAAGTVNQNGADYAEYMTKADGDATIAPGEVCGVNWEGKLTKRWSEAISFVVKSTNPGLVGNDNWFTQTKDEFETPEAFSEAEEAARQMVDRIAFCGQVPCTITGAFALGDWVVATEGPSGSIIATAVGDDVITFAQYRSAIGRIWKDLGSGKALVAIGIR